MLFPTLLILTLTGDGGLRVTLSESETMVDCIASQQTVTQILTDGGVEVVHTMCDEISLRLTPFEHGMADEQVKNLYRIDLTEEMFTVTSLAAGDSCASDPSATPAIYCARSAQTVLE